MHFLQLIKIDFWGSLNSILSGLFSLRSRLKVEREERTEAESQRVRNLIDRGGRYTTKDENMKQFAVLNDIDSFKTISDLFHFAVRATY